MVTNTVIKFLSEMFEDDPVSIINECNMLWFNVNDIAKIFGYTRGRHMTDIKNITHKKFKTIRGQMASFIDEISLYDVIFKSTKPNAQSFRKWVAGLIKQIRTEGFYIDDPELDIRFKHDYKQELDELKVRYAKEADNLAKLVQDTRIDQARAYTIVDGLDDALCNAYDESRTHYEDIHEIVAKHLSSFKKMTNADSIEYVRGQYVDDYKKSIGMII
jgi:prophage antirepressor-like protein